MMKMKKILLNVAFILAATLLGGCDDFFNPDTDVTLDNEDYISEESEMYSGYIGIMTKMQAIGDKVIYPSCLLMVYSDSFNNRALSIFS